MKDPVDMVEGEEMTVAELDQFIADADNYLQLETRKRTATGDSYVQSLVWNAC